MDNSVCQITRRSTGLTPAHVEMIRLLAASAVDAYLSEEREAEQGPSAEERGRVLE